MKQKLGVALSVLFISSACFAMGMMGRIAGRHEARRYSCGGGERIFHGADGHARRESCS